MLKIINDNKLLLIKMQMNHAKQLVMKHVPMIEINL